MSQIYSGITMWKRARGAPRTPFLGSRQEMYDEASRSACIKSGRTWCLVLNAQEGGWARIYSRLGVDTNGNTSATLCSPQILNRVKTRDHEKQPVKRTALKVKCH
jgi:hypothetical protein